MPYKLIKGTFHLLGRSQAGNPTSFQPDGDSIHFKPDNRSEVTSLPNGSRCRFTIIGSTNLRFEGIDATEIHFSGTRQPSPLAEDARDFVTGEFGMNPVTYKSNGYSVQPPANDGQRGYIFSKQLDVHGRPVSFVFVGSTSRQSGSMVNVDSSLVRQSLNYKLLKRGLAYPLFYDSLYHDLRDTMRAAAITAWNGDRGLWPYDWSNEWVSVANKTGIEQQYTIFPKLFRRIIGFHRQHPTFNHTTFVQWLNARSENDEVWVLPEWNRTHLDNVVQVSGGRIRLTRYPEDMVFVSRA